MTTKTMTGDRLHIGFFGRRNAGKSSLINAFAGQRVAIVSDTPGTTTDPIFKSMELAPLGPVVLIDTAGMDDLSHPLGEERKRRASEILGRTDLAILVVDSSWREFSFEDRLISRIREEKIPFIIAVSKIDEETAGQIGNWPEIGTTVRVSARNGAGLAELKQAIIGNAPKEWEPPFLRDLIRPGDIVLLVTPMDLGAPRGRLIMPQIKALRDILDGDAIPVMCKERELQLALKSLGVPPALVITDSQVFPQAAADVPEDIPLTSFSILSIRQKGNLPKLVEGIKVVRQLKAGDKVLIAESCSHHPLEDDIGRVKIPRWLNHQAGGGLKIDTVPGSDYPENIGDYKLVVHCGACTLNRREMLRRQEIPERAGVAMTNYGILIAFLKGVFPRALKPFNEIYAGLETKRSKDDVELRKRMARSTDI